MKRENSLHDGELLMLKSIFLIKMEVMMMVDEAKSKWAEMEMERTR